MRLQIFYVMAIVGIATVLLYLAIDRVLPDRWRKSETEASQSLPNRPGNAAAVTTRPWSSSNTGH